MKNKVSFNINNSIDDNKYTDNDLKIKGKTYFEINEIRYNPLVVKIENANIKAPIVLVLI